MGEPDVAVVVPVDGGVAMAPLRVEAAEKAVALVNDDNAGHFVNGT